MGARGPKPKPAELARRDGTYRLDRHGEPMVIGERIVAGALPDCPAHFDDEQGAAWLELLGPAAEYDLLREVDLAACEMMTVALVTHRQADAIVKREGMLVVVGEIGNRSTGYRDKLGPHPMISVRDRSAAEFRAWAARFGFTPSDRVSLGLGAVKTKSMAHTLETKIGKSPRARAT